MPNQESALQKPSILPEVNTQAGSLKEKMTAWFIGVKDFYFPKAGKLGMGDEVYSEGHEKNGEISPLSPEKLTELEEKIPAFITMLDSVEMTLE